jgi:putative transposase
VYRIHLTEAQRQELTRRAHTPNLAWRTRDRLEMVRLSDAGFSIPRIAQLLQVSEVRVRYWIKRFLAEGFEALPDLPHLGQQSALTPAILDALAAELQQTDRTWTAQQLADWVAEHHRLRLTPDYLARRLKRAKLSYKRTARSLKHKQDPEQAEQKQAELATLEKGGGRSPGSVPPRRSGLRADVADELQLVAGGTAAPDPV